MFAMAFISIRYSLVAFLVELVLAITATVLVAVSITNLKSLITMVLSGASKKLFKEESKNIDDNMIPMVILSKDNEIMAANDLFKENVCENEDPLGDSINKYLSGDKPEAIFGSNGTDTKYKDKWYIVFAVTHDYGSIVYFIDDNTYKSNSDEYLESRPVVAIVAFDNKDELEREADNSEAIKVTVAVEQAIVKWVSSTKGFYKKISGGRYIVVMEERDIKKSVDGKFKILDDIRTIKINDRLSATISIGVGRGGKTFKENEQWARQALDMALGRGGDQAAIKNADTYKFFGGVSKGIEKREKVRTRVIAASLTNHINNSSNVIIMGHRFSDLDSVGASIGMWSAVVKGLHKNAYILINRQQTLAKSLVASFEKAGFESIFKTEDEALALLDDHSLLIIVDTHSPNFLESKTVYERSKRVVVIDHHRMMVNHIDNALVFYHEPYASSASEMTAELVQYLGHDSLSRLESEALLSGIMLDTKNFVLRTGVRTFEAAAYLKSNGADTVEVKRLFSNSIDTYKVKYKLVSEAEIFNYCAIASAEEDIQDIRIASAQAADELLGIENVKASFVMYKTGKTVNISARSLGDLNVQVIMEQLGGGGHQTMAACQLENTSIDEAREKLVSIISELDVNKDDAAG
ncbi:MAG: DHH family phosphoesterase [Clostridia bacterium]|nr:DHH family phosphoesterase [Clostridia bacterium]